ncbi:retrovirus-related pol polyprotein from transposon TNT 1-94 [Tanacetum coccineum]
MGTIRFGNDYFAAITGYGDYVQGNLMILAFRSNTCYVRNLEVEDLLIGSRDSNLYTISISKMVASSPVYLMSKATSTKSWLWHRRLSHLNFGSINHLTKQDLVDGILRFKYDKDHLCSACQQGKSKKAIFPPKLVYFLRTKDEAPEMIIKFINQIQRNMKVQFLKVRSDNETAFKNKKLRSLYYPTNNHDDLGKMKPNAYIDIFIGPQIVPSLKELIVNDPIIPVSNDNTDEFVQEDVAKLDGNTFINPLRTHTKTHPTEQVIGDPSKHVMTRRRLHTDVEMCMYMKILITKEPTNIKEVMLDHNLIGSMQDELNKFKRLDVWELVERPIDRNIIKMDVMIAFLNRPLKEEVFGTHVSHCKSTRYCLAIVVCARYQARPTEKHLKEMQISQGVTMTTKAHLEEYKFLGMMTSNNITIIASFIPLIMEYLVKISKKARILELKQRHLKITILYVISIKEDTAYLCLHFTRNHEDTKSNMPRFSEDKKSRRGQAKLLIP